jgi:hypothetical protein
MFARLTNANLSNADLTGAHFIGAYLDGANMENANLTEAVLSAVNWDATTKWPIDFPLGGEWEKAGHRRRIPEHVRIRLDQRRVSQPELEAEANLRRSRPNLPVVMATKLYRPWSYIPGFLGFDYAIVYWFCVSRPEPLMSRGNLIFDYDKMNYNQKLRTGTYVSECLSLEECRGIKPYLLGRYGGQLYDNSVRLSYFPWYVKGSKPKLIEPPVHKERSYTGFVKICENADYNLPFDVWGYYTSPVDESLKFMKEYRRRLE